MYPPDVPQYRPNAAAIILNQHKRVFLGERADFPGAWQIPQGGIRFRKQETPEQALWRELREELGLENPKERLILLAEHDSWLRYDFPEWLKSDKRIISQYKGQIQRYFLLSYIGTNEEITLEYKGEREFRSFRWVAPEEMAENMAAFKVEVVEQAMAFFKSRFPEAFLL